MSSKSPGQNETCGSTSSPIDPSDDSIDETTSDEDDEEWVDFMPNTDFQF